MSWPRSDLARARSPTPARARCKSSALTLSSRAGGVLARAREQQRWVLPPRDATSLLSATVEMVLTDRVRLAASTLAPPEMRTLDAIHVASALALGTDLAAVVTYDVRMQQAAAHCCLRVVAPA